MNVLRAALLTIFWAFSFGWGRRWYRQFQLMAWRRKLTGVSEATSGAHVAEGIDKKKRFSLLELMLNYSNQGLAMVDAHGQVLIFNKRALEYTGVDPETFKLPATANDVRQWQLQNGEFGLDGALLPVEVRSYFLTGKGQLPKSYVRRRPDGTVLEVRSEPLPGGGIVQSYTDITEVTRAKEGAEAGARAKSAFLATMSHEVRTPLNGVLGVAALLRQTNLTEEQADYVRIIAESGDALLTVINDVLDFSKLEAGMMTFDPTPAALKDVASGALDLVRASAAAKGLGLSFEIDPDVPPRVLIDAKRVRQVLLNLFSNAVKFTAKGRVTLKVVRLAEPFSHHIRFEVRDTGIGISTEGRTKLFKEFSQVDGSIDRQYGGTGLGLAICKKIIEAMSGTIGVDSQEGTGSSFWFEIPAPASDGIISPEARPAIARISHPSYRILVVEDVATNQLVARKMLESLGHAVDIAGDGLEALDCAQKAHYDLIFMDMQLPGMNGLATTRKLRSFGGHFVAVPIVAMTANTSASDESECREAGMNDFISKPLDIQVLNAAIERVMVAEHNDRAWGVEQQRHAKQNVTAKPVEARTSVSSHQGVRNLIGTIGPEAMSEIVFDFATEAQSQLSSLEQHEQRGDTTRAARVLRDVHEGMLALGLRDSFALSTPEVWDPDASLPRLRQQIDAAIVLCYAEVSAASQAQGADRPDRDDIPSMLDHLVGHIGAEAMSEVLLAFIEGSEFRLSMLEQNAADSDPAEVAQLVADIQEGLLTFGIEDAISPPALERAQWDPAVSIPQLRQQVDAAAMRCRIAIASATTGHAHQAPASPCDFSADNPGIACCARGITYDSEFICERHLQMATASSVQRKLQTGARLQWLRSRWDDTEYFDRVVASGRYLKLCEALRWAEEIDEQAWTGVKQAMVIHSGHAVLHFKTMAEPIRLSA